MPPELPPVARGRSRDEQPLQASWRTLSGPSRQSPRCFTSPVELFSTSRVESCKSCLQTVTSASAHFCKFAASAQNRQSRPQGRVVPRCAQELDEFCDGCCIGGNLLHLHRDPPRQCPEPGVVAYLRRESSQRMFEKTHGKAVPCQSL